MCSISGFISAGVDESRGLGRESAIKAVAQMNRALQHRGPDDHGLEEISVASRTTLVLGNTRLAIIDVSSAGHQPMLDPETGNWLTYNGETYNFRQLRREIGDEFGPWKSCTDTEVVLRVYRKWGVAGLAKLRGMFALALWDNSKQKLLLARDRFGIKPLYYFAGHPSTNVKLGPFVFASEIRALLASGHVERTLSPSGVKSFLDFGSVEAPLTIIEGVRSLTPGQALWIKQDNSGFELDFVNYTTAVSSDEPLPQSRDQAKAQVRLILEDSVQQHLVSDVPIGVFLSGGMDSSAIVALMSRVSKDRPKTFSVVFNEKQFSEASHARVVAEKFKTDHCEVNLSEEALLKDLPLAIRALDQPTIDGVNTFVVSKAVKNAGVTVALSGLGGDELFGGYPSFRRALKFDSSNGVAKNLLRTIAPLGHLSLNGSAQRDKFWQLAATKGSPADVYRITRQLFSPDTVKSLAKYQVENVSSSIPSNGHSDVFHSISKLELSGYMANTLLRDTDSMSMAHSLEVRVPFVDTRVTDFVLRLPGDWKLNGETSRMPKPLLADVLTDLLPREFLLRKKMGFTLPFEKWMSSNLRNEISSVFADQAGLVRAGLEQKPAEQIWQRFIRQPKAVGWSRPWALYVLAKWCEANQVSI